MITNLIGVKIDQGDEGIEESEKSIVPPSFSLSLSLSSLIFIVETHLPNTSEFSALVTSSEIKRKGEGGLPSGCGFVFNDGGRGI